MSFEVSQADHIQLEAGWKKRLEAEFQQSYMLELKKFLAKEKRAGKTIYPKGSEIFQALNLTPFDSVKVVIIGQDPYHGPDQAHGLSFSVRDGVRMPPSLVNIYKEMVSDLDIQPPKSGDLAHWALQGVLLLNATLTVEAHKAGSHQKRGWESFTDKIIDLLNKEKDGLVFILWGSYAQKKGQFIDTKRHMVIKSPHPSPLSAHRGFFGSRPFSKVNEHLTKVGQKTISWV